MKNWKHMLLVARHELDEMALCIDRGISEPSITEFDIQFEKEREQGLHRQNEEAGDSPKAPYREPHFIATNGERTFSVPLKVDWDEYDIAVMES